MYNKKGVFQFLESHARKKAVSFHMPGHKGSAIYRKSGYGQLMKKIADYDITEINGADNLFQAEGIIKETADKYAELYGTEKSYLLINGTSGGILASVMAAVPKGGKLIMARNCHKSVFNALTLGGITPVYAFPEIIEQYGISGEVTSAEIEKLINENPDASAVILPSPNYYGICSDISAIAEVVHKYDKILIVDQAHGAHLKFFEMYKPSFGKLWAIPESAETCGADFVINSTHKTLASFTQSAVLNVCTERGKKLINVLEDKLQMVESTSPSYLLMASLDVNANIIKIHGNRLFKSWRNNVKWFYNKASGIPGLKLMNSNQLDTTKLNLDMSEYGVSGEALEKMLIKSGIYPELVTGNIVMCMTGIGNVRKDYKKLYNALSGVAAGSSERTRSEAAEISVSLNEKKADNTVWATKRNMYPIKEERELINVDQAVGRVCAGSIIPYPPGIPLVCPGEQIEAADVAYIKALREHGSKVIGIDENNKIWVQK